MRLPIHLLHHGSDGPAGTGHAGRAHSHERHHNTSEEVNALDAINQKLSTMVRCQRQIERRLEELVEMQTTGYMDREMAFGHQYSISSPNVGVASLAGSEVLELPGGRERGRKGTIPRGKTLIAAPSGQDVNGDADDTTLIVPSQPPRRRSRHVTIGAASMSSVQVRSQELEGPIESMRLPSPGGPRMDTTPTSKTVAFDDELIAQPRLSPDWPTSLKLHSQWAKQLRRRGSLTSDVSPQTSRSNGVVSAGLDIHALESELFHVETGPRAGFDPQSSLIFAWDLCCLVVLLYDLAFTPYMLAWDQELEGTRYAVAWLTFGFWVADFVMCFRTGFFHDGELHLLFGDIARHYLRTWCALDSSILVVEFLSLVLPLHELTANAIPTWALRVVVLLRIPRLVRVAKRCVMDRAFEYGAGLRVTIQCLTLIITVLWTTHMFCCAFYAVGRMAPSDTGSRWIVPGSLVEESGPIYQYLTSYHWALQQMAAGTMDVHPANSAERRLNIFVLIFGWLFGNSIVSSLMIFVVDFHMTRRERLEMLRRLNVYLKQNGIESEMALRVHKQVAEKMKEDRRLAESDVPGLALLSKNLRNELQSQMFRRHLRGHRLLQVWDLADVTALHRLSQNGCLYMASFPSGEPIFVAACECPEVFLLTGGEYKYIQESCSSMVQDERVITTVFAQGQCICEAGLWTEWIHVGTLFAYGMGEVLALKVNEFIDTVQGLRRITGFTQEYARGFHQRLLDAKPPKLQYPTDLFVPNADFNEIVLTMDDKSRKDISLLVLKNIEPSSSWGAFRNRAEIAEIQAKVNEGKYVLALNTDGEVERLMAVTQIEITDSQGSIFAHLGKIKRPSRSSTDSPGLLFGGKAVGGAVMKLECRLPGLKRNGDEASDEALQRLLSEDLGLATDAVQHASHETTKESLAGTAHRINILKLTTTHYATLETKYSDIHECSKCRWIEGTSLYMVYEEGIGTEPNLFDCITFYSWLSEKDFERLSGSNGEAELQRRMAAAQAEVFDRSSANVERAPTTPLLPRTPPLFSTQEDWFDHTEDGRLTSLV